MVKCSDDWKKLKRAHKSLIRKRRLQYKKLGVPCRNSGDSAKIPPRKKVKHHTNNIKQEDTQRLQEIRDHVQELFQMHSKYDGNNEISEENEYIDDDQLQRNMSRRLADVRRLFGKKKRKKKKRKKSMCQRLCPDKDQ